MRPILLATIAALLLCANTGCFRNANRCGGGTGDCGGLLGGMFQGRLSSAIQETQGWRHQQPEMGPAGPATGTYAYPYYTLHGPRDFLVDDPPSLGN